MRLGQAKEKLAGDGEIDLDPVRRLVSEAHQGAKDVIVELRDLARGIHPPVLDTGLEGALSTLAARSPLPTELAVDVRDRPTPSIEAIAYFCVAELLANVAQHAQASRASIACTQHGRWLRLVVRDDGRGGAQLTTQGSSFERVGRPGRSRARRRRPPGDRQPRGRPHGSHRRPAPRTMRTDTIRVAVAEDSAILRDGLVQLLIDRGFRDHRGSE